MIKKTITYIDYDGNERTEDLLFNLSKAELIEMELSESGGMAKMIERIIAEDDRKSIMTIIKTIITKAYGKKSDDGKRFIKSDELSKEFTQTEAYSELLMQLLTDEKAAADFINGLVDGLPKTDTPVIKTV